VSDACWSDADFFRLLSLKTVAGDPGNARAGPMAKNRAHTKDRTPLFGRADVVGETISSTGAVIARHGCHRGFVLQLLIWRYFLPSAIAHFSALTQLAS